MKCIYAKIRAVFTGAGEFAIQMDEAIALLESRAAAAEKRLNGLERSKLDTMDVLFGFGGVGNLLCWATSALKRGGGGNCVLEGCMMCMLLFY